MPFTCIKYATNMVKAKWNTKAKNFEKMKALDGKERERATKTRAHRTMRSRVPSSDRTIRRGCLIIFGHCTDFTVDRSELQQNMIERPTSTFAINSIVASSRAEQPDKTEERTTCNTHSSKSTLLEGRMKEVFYVCCLTMPTRPDPPPLHWEIWVVCDKMPQEKVQGRWRQSGGDTYSCSWTDHADRQDIQGSPPCRSKSDSLYLQSMPKATGKY